MRLRQLLYVLHMRRSLMLNVLGVLLRFTMRLCPCRDAWAMVAAFWRMAMSSGIPNGY